MTTRRFPSPWRVEEQAARFVVRDANGQALGYFYFRGAAKPPIRTPISRQLLSKDEARRIAADVAKLPELFRKAR
jgi:hypothetical protein